jgi:predicted nuclease with TOPRIM domain
MITCDECNRDIDTETICRECYSKLQDENNDLIDENSDLMAENEDLKAKIRDLENEAGEKE